MKHLIGLLFCIGFLLFAGTTKTQAQVTPTATPTNQVTYLDIVKPVISIAYTQNRFTESFAIADYSFEKQTQKGFTIDIEKVTKGYQLTAFSTNKALVYRYQYVPECPILYLSRGYGKYHYNHIHYIKRPKWQSNFNI